MARHTGTVARYKTKRRRAGATACDCCTWRPPAGLVDLGQTDGFRLMHAHHVLPLSCGGADDDQNLVLLCPNCHALAHRLGSITPTPGQWPEFAWSGPREPVELLKRLRMLVLDAEGWAETVRGERERAREEALAPIRDAEDVIAVQRRAQMRLQG